MKPLTKHSALVYFDHFNDDRSVYLADEADAAFREYETSLVQKDSVIAELRAQLAEAESLASDVRTETNRHIAELEAEVARLKDANEDLGYQLREANNGGCNCDRS